LDSWFHDWLKGHSVCAAGDRAIGWLFLSDGDAVAEHDATSPLTVVLSGG